MASLLSFDILYHIDLFLLTPLQAQAIVVTLDQRVTICNLYLSPNTNVNFSDLDNLVQQLPTLCSILGDFNAHQPRWGCSSQNIKGNLIEQLLQSLSYIIKY